MLLEAARQVQGDYVDIQALTCLLEGALVSWTGGDEVIVLLKLRYTEIRRVVDQKNVASSQYAQSLWNGKRQWIRYWRALETYC